MPHFTPILASGLAALALASSPQAQVRVQRLTDTSTPSQLFATACDIDGDRLIVSSSRSVGGGGVAVVLNSYRWDGASWQPEAQGTLDPLPGGAAQPLVLEGERAATIDLDGQSARVLELSGSQWITTATFVPDGPLVGYFADLALEGDRLVIGDRLDPTSASSSGAVLVYELQNGTWERTAKLLASDGEATDFLGQSVALRGNRIVAGAPNRRFPNHGGSGRVIVFEDRGAGWTEAAVLDADATTLSLGAEVAIDGPRRFLAYADSTVTGERLREYSRGPTGLWPVTEFIAPVQNISSYFAYDVAVSDGWLVCSSAFDPPLGGVQVYRRSNNMWNPVTVLQLSEDWLAPGSPTTLFGYDVALEGDLLLCTGRGSLIPGAPPGLGSRGNAWLIDLAASPTVQAARWLAERLAPWR